MPSSNPRENPRPSAETTDDAARGGALQRSASTDAPAARASTPTSAASALGAAVASVVSSEPTTPACPNCRAPLVDHGVDEGPKAGAWHCDQCGGCWIHRGSAWMSRPGHPAPDGWPPR